MNPRTRRVNVDQDRELLLEFHCIANYESETPWARKAPYACYRAKWFGTPQTSVFLSALKKSMEDQRTIAEIWETEDGTVAAYAWVTFTEIEGYGTVLAEVRDVAVKAEFRRQGIGTGIFRHIESLARKHGAVVLRSEVGIENAVSQGLHKKYGFAPHRVGYEKVLDHAAVEASLG